MFKRSMLFAMVILVSYTGCKKSETVIPKDTPPPHTKGVYVLNEGNFGRTNSTVTLYNPDSSKTYQDVLGTLGDTGNDIVLFGTKGFIVVNNSHKVIIFSTETNAVLGTIQLPNKSPRQIAVASETKAYVTNWNTNAVTVINPTTFQVVKDSIAVGSKPEGIAIANGKVYVCNAGWGRDSTVSVIDVATDKVVKTIVVGKGPNSIGVDADGDVLVQCSGYSDWSNPANDTPGSVSVISSKADTVIVTIPFPLATFGHPSEIAVSKNGYALLSVKNGIAKIDTKTNAILLSALVSTSSAYSIAVDDVTDYIYVADAKNYVTDGEVKIYDKNGNSIGAFTTGIIPGDIAFKH
ncbi:MAG: DUF5074 domain-containing protein [Bacteroidota bacterium]